MSWRHCARDLCPDARRIQKSKRPGDPMEIELSLEFLRVVEQAAIASAKTMGLGDAHKADQAAVESMRKVMTKCRWTEQS